MTDQPKPGLPTTEIFGMKLPVIAELADGWFLVAHPNGPAIARATSMAVMSLESAETLLPPDANGECKSAIPEAVRADAVKHFEEVAWPLVRGLYFETPDKGAAQ